MLDDDWADLAARAASRDEFVRRCPHPFLLALSGTAAEQQVPAPTRPMRTMRLPNAAVLASAMMAERRRMAQQIGRVVLAIRKRQSSYPHMITVGRAPNNDVVIADGLVSKFHAWFRVSDGNIALADAGSANGTRVNELALVANAEPTLLSPGDKIVFGALAFRFVDAAGAWAALRKSGDT
jgi:hypothetical protein